MKTHSQWQARSPKTATADKLRLSALLLGVLFILIASFAFSQDSGILKITIVDKKTKEPIPFANAIVYLGKEKIASGTADFDGIIIIKPLKISKYDVKVVYLGYKSVLYSSVIIQKDKTTYLNCSLDNDGVALDAVEVVSYKVPLIDPDTKSGATITREEYRSMSSKSVSSVVSTSAGVYSTDEGSSISVRGSRSGATIIDGERVVTTTTSGSSSVTIVPVMPGKEVKEVKEVKEPVIKAGTLTAGEINDFKKWELWKEIEKEGLGEFKKTWNIEPSERYSVFVSDKQNKPVIDAVVSLKGSSGKTLWQSHTNNAGRAELWANIFEKGEKADMIEINYEGKIYSKEKIRKFTKGINTIELPVVASIPDKIDIVFVVDATSSMSDEIRYLKEEMANIISTCAEQLPCFKINLGSVFYKDESDDYVTKVSPLSSNIKANIDFINEQSASGGGDYPEAVDKALKAATEEIKWSANAAARIMFLVLDAPPHEDEATRKEVLQKINKAAEMGIRIIPIAASGINKSTEYLMRSMALATNGTYVFLTDHSGVGGAHIKPTTDQYDVELLNQLLVRVIKEYSRTSTCDPGKNEQSFNDTTRVIVAHEVLTKPKDPKPPVVAVKDSLTSDSANVLNAKLAGPEKEMFFEFFPNPTSGKLTVKTTEGIKEVFLSDLSGKLIERFDLGKNGNEIDLGLLPDGAYLIQYTEGSKWYSGKVILAR